MGVGNMLLQMSLTAGALIALIFVLRFFFREKLPKMTFLILWFIVIARLLVPIFFYTEHPLQGLIEPVREVVPAVVESVPEILFVGVSPVTSGSGEMSNAFTLDGSVLLLLVWITGVLVTVLYFTITYWKLRKQLRFALCLKDNPLIDEWKGSHQLFRNITIWVSDEIKTPLTTGILRPKIYLPKAMDWENEVELAYILTHEFYHIKRFDALWKLVTLVALCLHWFNPLVWMMCMLVNRDLEVTCDAWVVKKFGLNAKKSYAFTLIGMAEKQKRLAPSHAMVLDSGFARNATDERIKSIMKGGKTTILGGVIGILVVPIFAFSAFAMPDGTPVVTVSSKENYEIAPLPAIENVELEVLEEPEYEAEIPGEFDHLISAGSKSIDGRNFEWNGTEWEEVGWDGVIIGLNTDPNQGHSVGIQALLDWDGDWDYWEDVIILSTDGVPGSRFYDMYYSEMWEVETVRGERYIITSWRSTNPTYPHAYEFRIFAS